MKRITFMIIGLMSMVGCAKLDSEVQGIGKDSAYVDTVARVRDEIDDAWVTLNGKIVKNYGDGLYFFRDATGEIRVRIDDKAWDGMEYNPGMSVILTGKVNKEFTGVEMVVKKVEVVTR